MERQVGVADSVSDVARAESAGVSSREGQEARVSETTHNSDGLRNVTLNAPFVSAVDGVKEVVNEHIGLAILLL